MTRTKTFSRARSDRAEPRNLNNNRNIGGYRMHVADKVSLRVRLLGGSSVLLAAVVVAGMGLAPRAALAANECGTNPNTKGPAPDGINCPSPPTTYTAGISHQSNGDLTVNVATGVVGFGTGGFVTTAGNLNDNLRATTSTTGLTTNTTTGTTAQVIIDVLSQAGSASVETNGTVQGAAATARYGIRARSTGAGAVEVAARGAVTMSTTSTSPAITAILAESNGGDVTVTTGTSTTTATTTGRLYGIQAHTSGAGDVLINTNGTVSAANNGGVAGIEAASATGDITMNLKGDVRGGTNAGAVSILTQSGGATTVNLSNASIVTTQGALQKRVVVRGSGAGSFELNVADTREFTNVLDRRGLLGAVDFSGLGGGASIEVGANSMWEMAGDSTFGDGDDTITIAEGGYFLLPNLGTTASASLTVAEDRYVMALGGGDNHLINSGTFLVGVDEFTQFADGVLVSPRRYEAELVLDGLSTFENAGAIYLGASTRYTQSQGPQGLGGGPRVLHSTDGWSDDILSMQGADFVGLEGSRLYMDVFYNGAGQGNCDASLRNAEGDMPAADCIDLRGGAAGGVTLVTLRDVAVGDRGAYTPDGVVVIDVSGGSADPGAFVLAPDSTGYVAASGGYIEKGLFAYVLGYDEAATQFKVYGVASAAAQQYPMLATAANELWRSATGSWFEHRQTGLPGADRGGDLGGGVWMRASGTSIERELSHAVTAGTAVLDFDNSYAQRNITVTVGADLGAGGAGDAAWLVGAMVGYTRAELEYDESTNTGNLEGAHAGAYGSFTAGPFFLDAALNGAWLTADSDAPALNLTPVGTRISGGVASLGVQVETGWRLALGPLGVEPLASLSAVRTSLDDLSVPAADPTRFGADVVFEDAKSLRGGLGVRLSVADIAPAFAPTNLSLTAKVVKETEGVASASIVNVGPTPASVGDTLEGEFGELNGAITFANEAQTIAGFLNVGGVFGDDYQSIGASLGLRYQW